MKIKQKHFATLLLTVLLLVAVVSGHSGIAKAAQTEKIVGIAWRADLDSEFYTNVCTAVKEAGGTPVLLGKVICYALPYTDGQIDTTCVDKNEFLSLEAANVLKKMHYSDSNVRTVMRGISAVIFTGGEDISPTLYATPADWHGIVEERDYNPTRDVSDYVLMQYCIDKDLQVLGLCRGMQMMATVSGMTMIQDVPTWCQAHGKAYRYTHRNKKQNPNDYRDYAPNSVDIATNHTLLFHIMKKRTLDGCPCWHHQMIKNDTVANVKISAMAHKDCISVVEAAERTDKGYIIGLQFHPEAAVVKHLTNAANKDLFMGYEDAMAIFRDFVDRIPSESAEIRR